MTKKKSSSNKKSGNRNSPGKPQAPVGKGGSRTTMWLVVAVIVLVVGAVAYSFAGGSKKADATLPTGTASSGPTAPTADEQKYIGRLLPSGYQEAKVSDAVNYTTTIKMTNLIPAVSGSDVSVPVKDVVSDKIVFFEYKSSTQTIPMLAYVKPSGKLFVGVSFCPPCKGTGQRIESDGTLTCESCGTKRDLETGAGISGACKRYPIDEVVAKVAGGKIVIAKTALDSWTPQPLDRPVGS